MAPSALLVLVLTLGTTFAQRFGTGPCPTYQTSDLFNAKKISNIVNREGFATIMSIGSASESEHRCQTLELFDSSSYAYTYTDENNDIQKISGRYVASPSSFKRPGSLEFSNLPTGVLGADVFGNVRLYPLLVDTDGTDVYASCISFALLHAERVYVMAPKSAAQTRNIEVTQADLQMRGVPKADKLIKSDLICKPPVPAVDDDAVAAVDAAVDAVGAAAAGAAEEENSIFV